MSVGLEPLPEEEGCGAAGTKVCARSANNHHYAAFNGQRFNNMTTETTTTSWSLKLEESDYCRSSDSGFVEGCSNLNLTMEAEVIAAKAASSAQWAKTKRKNSAIWNFWISARGAIKLHPFSTSAEWSEVQFRCSSRSCPAIILLVLYFIAEL